ncbi:DNA-dependent ATPase fun30 [Entomophthora muscae]|uniref:DNA-dependent ATPase fun30 n=1 Tax=Entomophthora muscae TaxID=34485 RepID=A0ACC2RJQ3_9FUNG|nr:DNA-dependent ATPase fun30 [Entomophthora muscae]
MGLGKTCQVITMIGRLIEEGTKGPHLVVVPSSVFDNWLNEFERFCPTISVLPYRGSQKERADIYDDFTRNRLPEYDVVVSSYNLISSNTTDRKFMKKMKFRTLILDEAHQVKNPKTQTNQNLMKLGAPFRLLMTGTPLQNNLTELLTLLTFINPKFFSSTANEKMLDVIVRSGSFFTKDKHLLSENALELSKARIEKVKAIMVPFILRRCKEQVLKDLPKKTEFIQRCPLTKTQRSKYSDAINSARLDTTQGIKQLLSVSFALRRIANHTMLIPRGHHFSAADRRNIADRIIHDPTFYMSDKDVIYEELLEYDDGEINNLCNKHKCINKFSLQNEQWMESGKVEWLRKELPLMIQRGDRALIFSQFTMMLDILERVLKTLNISFLRIDGQTPVDERQGLIDSFNTDAAIKAFLISTRSGGCGINLTGANVVILHDIDHNPQNDRQAEARAHRVGQIRDVSVYKLVSENTIEERILAIGNAKLELHTTLSGDARQLGDEASGITLEDSGEGEGDILKALRDELSRPQQ